MAVLHVVYRSCGGENRKDRPAFYSKSLCLQSLLCAVENAQDAIGDIVFVNDGEIPADREQLMSVGDTVRLPDVGNSRSIEPPSRRSTVAVGAIAIPRPFSEDDYLYKPHSACAVLAATERLPDVDYFTLYDHPNNYGDLVQSNDLHRTVRRPTLRSSVGEVEWRNSTSTCLSFVAREVLFVSIAGYTTPISTGPIPHDFKLWLTLLGTDAFRMARWLPQLMGAPLESRPMALSVRVSLRTSARRTRSLVSPRPAVATHLQGQDAGSRSRSALIAADRLPESEPN